MFRLINKLKNRKGFTLIELIVVLAVLAVIMAIAIPRFVGVRDQAERDSDLATINSIKKLAELEYVRINANTSGAAVLSKADVEDLIEDNFDESNLFQSDDFSGADIGNITITFDSEGTVTSINVDGESVTY